MHLHKQSPYVGPVPFQFSDARFFRGRDSAIRRIVNEIFVNRVLLIYAPSGAGKTSLLNAGIIPRLKQEGFEVLPPARVGGLAPHGINVKEIRNLYALNSIYDWIGTEADLKQLSQMTLRDYLKKREHPLDEVGQSLLRVVIFDQLEKVFADFPKHWQDRAAFFKEVHEALQADHLLRVVLVLREDSLGAMESYASLLPDKPQTRFRLELLRREDALSAVIDPIRESGRSFDVGAAEKLVEDLLKIQVETPEGNTEYVTGEFIEPAQLQFVCHTLWQTLPIEKKVITIEDIEAFANVDHALSRFYDEALEDVARGTGVHEKLLREWFGHTLITASGTRAVVLRGANETGGLPNVIVDRLVNKHLIRAEFRAGALWYELAHDRFIQPIVQSNQKHSRTFKTSADWTPFSQ